MIFLKIFFVVWLIRKNHQQHDSSHFHRIPVVLVKFLRRWAESGLVEFRRRWSESGIVQPDSGTSRIPLAVDSDY
jgi:hypothetical protein